MLDLPTPDDLRDERLRVGLTQAELADRAGVSQSLVARVELGEVDPSYSTLQSIVDALNEAEDREPTLGDVKNEPVAHVAPSAPIREAVDLMREREFSQLPVLDGDAPVGSLSEAQIVHALSEGDEGIAQRSVREIMGAPFPALAPDEPLDAVMRMLENRPAVLAMQQGRVVGVVTKADLIGRIEESA
jgi:predicted transcriptional regulator